MATVPTFTDLNFGPRKNGLTGVQAWHDFDNGYAASIIRGNGTYGEETGLYELAVIADGRCCYSTPVTDDVLGHLSEQDVTDALAQIAALSAYVGKAA